MSENSDRKSEAESADLIADPQERAEAEVANGFRQFDAAMAELGRWKSDPNYKLRQSLLLRLNRIALVGVNEHPGVFRAGEIKIRGSGHQPPPPDDVPTYVEEFCDYVNDNWERKTPIHLAAYAMWRLNWIHPFADGNGRTSRIVSYLILCAKIGNQIPGSRSIPEQIVENKKPYYDALEGADKAFEKGIIDVSEMEKLLDEYLAAQLVDVHNHAAGGLKKASQDTSENRGLISTIEAHPVVITSAVAIILAIIGWLIV